MKKQIATSFISIALGLGAGLVFSVGAQTTFTVQDDGVTAKEALSVLIETPVVQTQRMSLNDVTSQITSLDNQIAELQARRAELVIMRDKIQVEVDTVPPRATSTPEL